MRRFTGMLLLMILICTMCCSCSPNSTHPMTEGKNEEEKTSHSSESEILAQEDVVLHDFHVSACFSDGLNISDEDIEASFNLARQFLQMDERGDEKYYISQPYPILNLEWKALNAFVFDKEGCVGVLSFRKVENEYSGSFAEGEIPDLTRFYKEKTAFVTISDGMRLWFISEDESRPYNLEQTVTETIPWLEEYTACLQEIGLTELKP